MMVKSIVAAAAAFAAFAAFAERDTAIYRGKLTSDMNANSNRISNVAFPSAPGDAANKVYVDQTDEAAVQEAKRYTDAATNSIRSVDGAARPLPKYLHLYETDDSYPEAAQEYYRSRGDGKTDGGCSAFRDGGFLYRNFDFPFDDRAEFVVKMSAGAGRFASVGVAQVGTNLTEQMVTSGKPEFSARYKWLPGATVDGINENGVVCEINVVDGDPQTSGWHETGDIHPLGAVRWALDNGTSAGMVASNIAASIHFPQGWAQNFHYMVADETATYIVENGTAYPIIGRPVLTNFRIAVEPPDGPGVERYNILMNPESNITNVWFTLCYERSTNPPWLSEFGNNYEYWNAALNAWELKPKEAHRGEIVNGESWWQSIHTSIYDITNRTLRVAVQEVDDWYVFAVPSAGGVKVETDPTVPAWAKAANPPAVTETDPTVADWARKPNPAPVTDLTPATNYTDAAVGAAATAATNYTDAAVAGKFDSEYDDASYFRWHNVGGVPTIESSADIYTGGSIKGYYVSDDQGNYLSDKLDRPYDATHGNIATFGPYNELVDLYIPAEDVAYIDFANEVLYTQREGEIDAEKILFAKDGTNTVKSAINTVSDAVSGKRDKTDLSLDEWIAGAGAPTGITGQPNWIEDLECWTWLWYTPDGRQESYRTWDQTSPDDPGPIELYDELDLMSGRHFTATRDSIAKESQLTSKADRSMISATDPTFSNAVVNVRLPFGYDSVTNAVAMLNDFKEAFGDLGTGDIVGGAGTIGTIILALIGAAAYLKKKTALLETDGKPTDDFATDLIGKPVAKEAIDNRTKASASAITGDALTLPDGGVVSASSSAPTITFGTARQDGLRFCELYITNPDTAADGAIVSISGKVYSDISLTELPKLEKGSTYYFTFAEFKVTQETVEGETVSVSHWKVSKQKLEAMGGDIPTPTAA